MTTKITITKKKEEQMTITKSVFGLYLGQEIDKIIDTKGLDNQKALFDELYFMIKDRFEPFFLEIEDDENKN